MPAISEYSFNDKISDILGALGVANNIVITTHINPDGDAIGSTLGLWNALHECGKNVTVINHSPTPANLQFLSGAEHIRVFHPKNDFSLITSADIICILDVNNIPRLESVGEAIEAAQGIKIVIDHHQEPQDFADIYGIDADASSVCEMITRLLIAGGYRISDATASALYTGIMTDSGNFRFSRTDAELHRLTASLIEYGADPVKIYDCVYNTSSLIRMRMLGRALAEMEIFAEGQICVMTIRKKDFVELGGYLDDTEGFVQNTLSIGGVKIGMTFTEFDDIVKVSLRSKGDVSAVNIAKHFNGGGHFHAAAARFRNQTLDEVLAAAIARATAELKAK
ncbi:bifunctional oligoribonuclease/PAP phosphatase NrnA [Ignavibacteria bacterium]|nr:bifunctional oligoribonuclease/PAP phosphatase NrnA [Bacteroidota bacterium]MCZ2132806.1 bifunctional oligoribonuclease/PAP phosphatase NrnA [Bacteroidota bacterium]